VFTGEAYIGVIMMGGVVVNNAILLVDHINRVRRERGHLPLEDAVIQGTLERIRPIFMTTATTVLGMLPLVAFMPTANAKIWNALTYALIGGLLSSTLFVLTTTPAFYLLFERGRVGAAGARRAVTRAGVAVCLLCAQMAGCARGDAEGDSTAEGEVTVAGDPVCEECTIEFREVAVLGAITDPTSVSEDAALSHCTVGMLSTGEYVLSSPVGGGELVVYDGRGQFLRTIGRPGQGPGEFGRTLRLLVGPGDTLYVHDFSQRRLQVLTASGALVRSLPFNANARDFSLLENGTIAFFASISQRGDPTIHLVDAEGVAVESFRTGTRDQPLEENWILSPRPGGFWMASMYTYDLFRAGLDGSVEQTLRRDVGWFPPADDRPFPGADPSLSFAEAMAFLPPPYLAHVWEDDLGRLWTYSLIPDPNWEPGFDPSVGRVESSRRRSDMVVEVLDLASGRALARTQRDQKLGWFCGSPLLYDVIYSTEGDTRVQVLQPELVRP
jgi:hypothetical protein